MTKPGRLCQNFIAGHNPFARKRACTMAHVGRPSPAGGCLQVRSRQSRCRLSICQARGRQLRVRASDESERGPEQQPENNALEMSNRRLLLMAGAAGIASALPMWLSMAARGRGRAQAATLADQQVLLPHVMLSPPVCARAYIGFQGPEANSGTCPRQPQSASVNESMAEQCCAAMRRRICPQSGILASPQPPSLLTRHPSDHFADTGVIACCRSAQSCGCRCRMLLRGPKRKHWAAFSGQPAPARLAQRGAGAGFFWQT